MMLRLAPLSMLVGMGLCAQTAMFEGHPATTLQNDQLALTILTEGTAIAKIVRKDDPAAMNPLWDPARMARETGRPNAFQSGTGHFLCVDGFGGVSPEEKAAGFPSHGEAHLQTFRISSTSHEGNSNILRMEGTLPLAQEKVVRTFRLVDGEQTLAVETTVENLLSFDRPLQWAEHATVGSPFLETGTTVNMSAVKAKTRPYVETANGLPRRLVSGQNFTWPMAPAKGSNSIDMRETPAQPNSMDHVAVLVDTTQRLGWVTALNPAKQLLIGYLFRREEYPWIQTWQMFPPTGKLARGMEFSTQPFDVPRREIVTMGSLFDTLVYRWLPAKSTVGSKFLMFYVHVPKELRKVDSVRLENGNIVVEDKDSGNTVRIKTAQTI